MPDKPSVFAIDFGTSNSLLAAASATKLFDPVPLEPGAADPSVLRSALYFTDLQHGIFGAQALEQFIKSGFRGRLIRSIKRHLPSRSFTMTRIGDSLVTLEQLIGAFLGAMRERAERYFETDVTSAVLGRPARFSNDGELDALAETRLRRAAEIAGFRRIELCPEPVAAAYDFAADLADPRNVLVADLGGGTSDFTLVRMQQRGFTRADVLSVGGVAVAGDAIDGALVRARLAPQFGSTVRYRVPLGHNLLEMPVDLIDLLCSPADLTLVDRKAVLRRISDIRAGAVDRATALEKLDRLSVLIEDGVGFTLFEAVEGAKRRLSMDAATRLVFDYPGAELDLEIERSELEQAAARPLERIVGALEETLRAGGLRAEQVDILCVTGGTSRMPLVLAELRRRLPQARLRRLSSFHSVVQGLARRAREIAAS